MSSSSVADEGGPGDERVEAPCPFRALVGIEGEARDEGGVEEESLVKEEDVALDSNCDVERDPRGCERDPEAAEV